MDILKTTEAETYGLPWLKMKLPFACEIHWCTVRGALQKNRFRVLLHHSEPKKFMMENGLVRTYSKYFHLILTNQIELLDLPNAKFMLFGDKWADENPAAKEFSISFLYSNGVGNDELLPGYKMRRELWNRKSEIKIPIRFWTSARKPPNDINDLLPIPNGDRNLLFNSMFTISIENSKEQNYFSEKIIDPFSTATFPIYIGCPNLHEYFDPSGYESVDKIDHLIDFCNSLKPSFYWSKLTHLGQNLQRAEKYWNWQERVKAAIINAYIDQSTKD